MGLRGCGAAGLWGCGAGGLGGCGAVFQILVLVRGLETPPHSLRPKKTLHLGQVLKLCSLFWGFLPCGAFRSKGTLKKSTIIVPFGDPFFKVLPTYSGYPKREHIFRKRHT